MEIRNITWRMTMRWIRGEDGRVWLSLYSITPEFDPVRKTRGRAGVGRGQQEGR